MEKYKEVVIIPNRMIIENLSFARLIKRSKIHDCVSSAIDDGFKNFKVEKECFIDTTEEPDKEICNNQDLFRKYESLKASGESEYSVTVLAW